MQVHLVDGTYELFRQHFGQASRHEAPGPFAATVGVIGSTLQLVAEGATHVGIASDHVIESFRNDLWPGYKTSEGMLPELLEQIPIVEEALAAPGTSSEATSRAAPIVGRLSMFVRCLPEKEISPLDFARGDLSLSKVRIAVSPRKDQLSVG